jgi:hypothetical protein
MGKKEKNEMEIDKNTIASPRVREFDNEKYDLVRVEETKEVAKRNAKGVREMFPGERTRVAPVTIKAERKMYGVYFKDTEKQDKAERKKREKDERKQWKNAEEMEKKAEKPLKKRIKETQKKSPQRKE